MRKRGEVLPGAGPGLIPIRANLKSMPLVAKGDVPIKPRVE